MKIKEEEKDLNFWKKNCEENLIHTPISVIRYIVELEKAVNNGVLDDVSNSTVKVCEVCKTKNLHYYPKTNSWACAFC